MSSCGTRGCANSRPRHSAAARDASATATTAAAATTLVLHRTMWCECARVCVCVAFAQQQMGFTVCIYAMQILPPSNDCSLCRVLRWLHAFTAASRRPVSNAGPHHVSRPEHACSSSPSPCPNPTHIHTSLSPSLLLAPSRIPIPCHANKRTDAHRPLQSVRKPSAKAARVEAGWCSHSNVVSELLACMTLRQRRVCSRKKR